MSKKKKQEEQATPLETLLRERQELEERYDQIHGKAGNEMSGAVFKGGVGAVALLALDWTIFGGVFSFLAAANAVDYVRLSRESKKIKKQLVKLDERIEKMQDEEHQLKLVRESNPNYKPPSPLTEEFTPAAQKQISDLEKELNELKQKIEDNEPKVIKKKPGIGFPPKD